MTIVLSMFAVATDGQTTVIYEEITSFPSYQLERYPTDDDLYFGLWDW